MLALTSLAILGHFPVSPDQQVWTRSYAPFGGVIQAVDCNSPDQQVWARSYAPCGGVIQAVDCNVAFDG